MMDSTFRDERYKRFVFLGKRTIKEGECMAIWLLDGRQKIVEGPRRKRLWCSNIRFLTRHQVDQHQYIVIYHRSGRREHIRGPFAMFANPVLHQRVEIKNVVSVDGFESLVVYKESDGEGADGLVKRRIVRGPCQFVPDANEWVHEFNWRGLSDDKERQNFTKLRIIPEQLPINCSVRTSNDVVLTVSVMVVFECVDIERMLDTTRDPVGDFFNSISADLLGFAAKVSYERFLEVSANMLSNLETFPLLLQRAEGTGFKIHKVVYRGYKSNKEIQEMIEARVKLETELKLENVKLESKAARVKGELELDELVHAKRLQRQEAEQRVELEATEKSNAQQIEFLGHLKTLGVDVTKYLVSLHDKPDKVIRVDQANGEKVPILINTK